MFIFAWTWRTDPHALKNQEISKMVNMKKSMVHTNRKGMIFLRPLWLFDHVLNIMLCFLCLFVLLYDIGIKFDMIYRSLAGIPSGPVALNGFKFLSSLVTLLLLILMLLTEGWELGPKLGMAESSSLVKTDVNCLFSTLAFCLGSVWMMPFSFSGATPSWSHRLDLTSATSFLLPPGSLLTTVLSLINAPPLINAP